jgi:hypothetical protein
MGLVSVSPSLTWGTFVPVITVEEMPMLEFSIETRVNNVSDFHGLTDVSEVLASSVTHQFKNDNNSTETLELPIYMQFNAGHLLSIIVYSVLFVVAALGNISLFVTIIR